MKKFSLMVLLSGFGALVAGARGLDNIVLKENNFRNTLWFNTENSAALAFNPLMKYNELFLSYNRKGGEEHPWREAKIREGIEAETSGYANIGGYGLWGKFSFNNILDRGQRGNAIMYEVPYDMPYYVVDTVYSHWNRQEYDMSMKIASPAIKERLSLGLQAGYTSKVGAKQRDPRAETFVTDAALSPSAAYRFFGRHLIGLSGLFKYHYERSFPSNNNYHIDRIVYITKGLGEGELYKVGGNDGLKEYDYKGFLWGGSLQYGYKGGFSVVAETGAELKKTDVNQSVSLPKNMGTARSVLFKGSIQALWGKNDSDRLLLEGRLRMTDGVEKIQERDNKLMNQKWVTLGEYIKSSYINTYMSLSYDRQLGEEPIGGYNWNIGGGLVYIREDDEYFAPRHRFNWSSLSAAAFGAKFFRFQSSDLLAKVSAGYTYGIGGEYIYTGNNKTIIIQDFWREELYYRLKSRWDFGVRAAYTFHSGKINYVFDCEARFFTGYRLLTKVSIGILF